MRPFSQQSQYTNGMTKAIKILVPNRPEFLELAREGLEVQPYDPNDTAQQFDHADGVLFMITVAPEVRQKLLQTPGLEWVLTLTAGIDPFLGNMPDGVRLFHANDLHAHAVAVHVLAGLLNVARRLHIYRDRQRDHLWKGMPDMTTLKGETVALWGYGHIGRELEPLLQALGVKVRTVRSNTGEAEQAEIRAEADYIVLLMPSTPQTRGSVDAKFLHQMKAGAWLHNIGRGDLVVTDDLVKVLRGGKLGGAILDVTDPEPLPKDSPLWEMPNVVITPHVGSSTADIIQRAADYAADFIDTLRRGEQPKGEANLERGY